MIFDSNSILYFQNENSGGLVDRTKIDDKYKWNLKDVYSSEDKWEEDFDFVKNSISGYEKFKGKLSSTSDVLLECLKFDESLGIKIGKLYLYSMLAKDIDLGITKYQGLHQRIVQLVSEVEAASSFIKPEILNIPKEKIDSYIESNDDLKTYKHLLNDLIRKKKHTLSEDKEELLANSSPALQTAYETFGLFNNADIQFPKIKDDKGNEVLISHGRYTAAMYSDDRDYRKRFYKEYYKPFITYKNTLSALFNGNIKADIFKAKARKYNSTLEAALDPNNIPVEVYNNLVNSVEENLSPLHRWVELKKKIMGIDEFHPYDVYVSCFPTIKKEFDYDESVKLMYESLAPLGDDYISNLERAFENRWIDVYETKGKRSGAYSSGTTFGVHPYVLLNWNDQLNDVFTLAHEMGHNMHSYYTEKFQPYHYASYSIFIAEVTSTLNEALLLDYLIRNSKSKSEKLALLEKHLLNIITTFYRQTLFARFEKDVHSLSEKGQPLTPDFLCEHYGKLQRQYWGENMVVDEEETYTWARVPHFYYNFYVYQYATSFAASEVLVELIKSEGDKAVLRYQNFLKAGNSDYPINVLTSAGVDMTSAEPIIAVTKKMNSLIDSIEELID